MKRGALVSVAVVLLAVIVPAAALAKGASEAEIAGPGLDSPISLPGETGNGTPVWRIAEDSGFYAAVFDESLASMLAEPPNLELGPRYTITYVMPGPSGEEDRIVQDVYPYAQPSPVAFVAPDQPFFGSRRTQGGWFVAARSLKEMLVQAGLPRNPPLVGRHSELPWRLAGPLTAVILLAALGGLATLFIPRRPQTA